MLTMKPRRPHMSIKTLITPEQITKIVQNNFYGIETIKTRNSDSLDFHDVAIWSIRSAIVEAYNTGYTQAIQDKNQRKNENI